MYKVISIGFIHVMVNPLVGSWCHGSIEFDRFWLFFYAPPLPSKLGFDRNVKCLFTLPLSPHFASPHTPGIIQDWKFHSSFTLFILCELPKIQEGETRLVGFHWKLVNYYCLFFPPCSPLPLVSIVPSLNKLICGLINFIQLLYISWA